MSSTKEKRDCDMNDNGKTIIVKLIAVVIMISAIALGIYLINHREQGSLLHIQHNNVQVIPSGEIKDDSSTTNKPILEDADIIYNTEFGGINVDISIEDFNALGFKFGDSVDIEFSNGYTLEDIPYYNGYYVNYGDTLVVGYPGYERIRIGENFGEDLWQIGNLNGDEKCTITLNEAEKYLDTQEARNIQYSDIQEDIPDEIFANFRPMNVGNLKENIIYRGASPIDNLHNRAPVVDRLIKREGIKFIIDLADDENEVATFKSGDTFNSPYFVEQCENGNVVLLNLEAYFKSEKYINGLVHGYTEMSKHDGPYYIHCQEGKDRTGYVCMVIEMLTGASYDEIEADYMKTYDNYYGITKESDFEKYEVIKNQNLAEMLKNVINDDNVDAKTADLQKYAEEYLLRIGMKAEDISALRQKLEK